jgi:4a-hydroxytetrahydrobiopterin dehydratase
MIERITPRQFHESDGVEEWRLLGDGACTYFPAESFTAKAQLVNAISELADLDDHHVDVDLRRNGLTVRLFTFAPAPDGLSTRDVELARQISAVARKLGVTADPSAVQSLHLSIDALVIPDVLPFWRAVLGYEPRVDTPDVELNDPHDRWPTVFFQQMDAPRPQRNRIHLDVWVPLDQAEARVQAALAAGGRMLKDEDAPAGWGLADAEGNEACVVTWRSAG